MGSEWQDISTAPKEGTIIWLRNKVMVESKIGPRAVKGRWGDFWGYGAEPTLAWVTEFTEDPETPGWPTPAGRLVCPDEWKPLSAPPSTPQGGEK